MSARLRAGLALAAVAALLLLAWQVTEWVEVEVELPPTGPARTNPLYSVQQLAQRVGARVELMEQFDRLPPVDATLLLTSPHWKLLPGREKALREWVERGGHLVVRAGHDEAIQWTGLRLDWNQQDARLGFPNPPAIGLPTGPRKPKCRMAQERDDLPPAHAGRGRYELCDIFGSYIKSRRAPLWSLDLPPGPAALIVPFGQGTVGAYADDDLFANRGLLTGDHALVAAALLRAAPGRIVWLVPFERRDPLLQWLWQQAWPSLLLGLLALVLWLARRARRFGPPLSPLPVARRSLVDQVRGTAHFLWRHEPAALERAQREALLATARRLPHPPALPEARGTASRKTLPARLREMEALRRRWLASLHRPSNRSSRR